MYKQFIWFRYDMTKKENTRTGVEMESLWNCRHEGEGAAVVRADFLMFAVY